MYVITVIPIKKGFGEQISYFSATPIEEGALVNVPLRKSEIQGLVLNSEPAENQKAELKASDFSLRKITEIKSKAFLPEAWMKAMRKFAEFFAISEGEALASLIPKVVLENVPKLSSPENPKSKSNFKLEFFHGKAQERVTHYKGKIREEFAKGRSVFLVLSKNEEIERAREVYSKGIEDYCFMFEAGMTKAELIKKWKELAKLKHPSLVICHANFLFLPVKNLGLIILDNEQENAWRSFTRPFIDYRKFVETLAEELGVKLLLGDLVLSVESLSKYQDNYLNFHSTSSADMEIIDLKKEILSNELFDLVRETKEKNGNMFIYATRKGLSSMTVCRDCGEEVICNNCGAPVVLYKKHVANIFKCHQCGEIRSAQEVCKNCGSWRLLPLGVGVEKVVEEIKKVLPDTDIFEINKEATSTSKAARSVAEKFYKTPGSVLVGTEMALDFLEEPLEFCAIASIDSLFAIPNFRIREKIFHLLLEIRSLAIEKFLVQVRNTEKETIELAISGNILDFYKREIKEREELQYPPFSVFAKITVRGTRNFVEKEVGKLVEILKAADLKIPHSIFPSSSEKLGEQYAMNCVMKLKGEVGPDQKLISLLRSLPSHFEIKINPENLL